MPDTVSDRSLEEKLGLKPNLRTIFLHAPPGYLSHIPTEKFLTGEFEFIQFFAGTREELEHMFPVLVNHLADGGMIWISWPKKSSPKAVDLDENVIRELGLPLGVVDVKVCAIDTDWSGLKFLKRAVV